MFRTLLLCFILTFSYSVFSQVKIYAKDQIVVANDGYQLNTYELITKQKLSNKTTALFFYIQGSGCNSVTDKINFLASAIIMGGRAIVMEKRGCLPDKINTKECHRFYDKDTRLSDHLRVIEYFSKDVNDIPIILIGGSEGGDIAAKIAAKSNKVTHLILIGSGGGISQIEELEILVKEEPGYLNLKSENDLKRKVKEINNSKDDSLLWAGLPYKRWKSFWNDPSINYLEHIKIPVLLLHGSKDTNVPVESARTLNNKLNEKIDLTYIEYKNLDHSFNDINDQKSRYPYLEIDIVKWLSNYSIISNDDAEKFVKRVKRNHKKIFK
ncbi:alpha/beta hydrolase [uncultured Psychroserpens sp.]|uniref:alpha/beta hydrolase family protein n=1 Tax=uncultured Psychroserpens sp. TaxID=255436 RepID=UPI002609EFB6|nr:alpha/beta hydrolase [uncultured Psychroserpens sp.]